MSKNQAGPYPSSGRGERRGGDRRTAAPDAAERQRGPGVGHRQGTRHDGGGNRWVMQARARRHLPASNRPGNCVRCSRLQAADLA